MTAQKLTECLTTLTGIKASIFKSDKETAELLSQQMIHFLQLNNNDLSTSEKATLLLEFSQLKLFNFASRDIIFKNGSKGVQVAAHPSNDIVSIAMLNVLNYLQQHDDATFVQALLQEKNPAGLTLSQVLPKHQDSRYTEPHPNLLAIFKALEQTTEAILSAENNPKIPCNTYDIPVLGHGYQPEIHDEYYSPVSMTSQTMNSIGSAPAQHPTLTSNDVMEMRDMHKIHLSLARAQES